MNNIFYEATDFIEFIRKKKDTNFNQLRGRGLGDSRRVS